MKDKRLADIADTLFKFTRWDFSQKLEISKQGDEIDVIAYGLNTMAEEIQRKTFRIEKERDTLKPNNDQYIFMYSVESYIGDLKWLK